MARLCDGESSPTRYRVCTETDKLARKSTRRSSAISRLCCNSPKYTKGPTSMLRNFFAREDLGRNAEGQTLVEYGLLLALIAVVCVVAVTALGGTVNGIFTKINASI